MKLQLVMWACLAMLQISPLQATETDSLTSTSIDTPDSFIETPPTKKAVIRLIPELDINLQVLHNNELMLVNLSRALDGEVEWMIFQPNAGVVSRITTDSKIDEIKLDNLPQGDYVLRVKDNQGRLCFKSFHKA